VVQATAFAQRPRVLLFTTQALSIVDGPARDFATAAGR